MQLCIISVFYFLGSYMYIIIIFWTVTTVLQPLSFVNRRLSYFDDPCIIIKSFHCNDDRSDRLRLQDEGHGRVANATAVTWA